MITVQPPNQHSQPAFPMDMRERFCLLAEYAEHSQYNQKSEIEGRKQQNIVSRFAFVVLGILPECNQAGKGRNQCTYSANVDTQQKLFVVIRKLGQQDRRGNIADDLTGQYGYKERVFLQQEGKQ